MAFPATTGREEFLLQPEPYSPALISPTTYDIHRDREGDKPKAAGFWRGLRNDVLADLCATNWVSFTISFLFYAWIIGLGYVISSVTTWMSAVGGPQVRWSACKPDGSFNPHWISYDVWSISGFFQITMGFGALTFTQAKVIDVIWDVGVGRLGQAFLTWYSLKAFSSYIRSAMDRTPITYDTFWTFFVRDDASFLATVRLVWDFCTRRSLRSRVAMVFIILSMSFVLAFPTMASAMTGYTANSASFVPDHSGNLISFSQFQPLVYVIHDGWRIGLTGDYPVTWEKSTINPNGDPLVSMDNAYTDSSYYLGSWSCKYASGDAAKLCEFTGNVSSYAARYGFLGLDASGDVNNIESQWMGQTLPKPTLNITSFFIGARSDFYGSNWTDPRTKTQPFSNSSTAAFYNALTNSTFKVDYVTENGVCQPTRSYQWGFSFLQFFIVLICLLVWSVGIHVVYLVSQLSLKNAHRTEVPAKYKAAIELTHVMRREFDHSSGDDPAKLTERQMQHRIDKLLGGGRMELERTGLEDSYTLGKTLKLWIKKEKWWFTAMAILTPFILSGWFLLSFMMMPALVPLYWMMLCITVAVYFSIAVGRARRSRLFFTFFGVIIGLLVYVGEYARLERLRDSGWRTHYSLYG